MDNLKKNRTVSTSTTKLIQFRKIDNNKSYSTNKTSILYLNDISDVNIQEIIITIDITIKSLSFIILQIFKSK